MNKTKTIESISYYVHHSSWGSYASFILGKLNRRGGFVLSNVNVPDTNIYIGYKHNNEKPRMFPFFSTGTFGVDKNAYTTNSMDPKDKWCYKNVDIFKEKEIKRQLEWATDTWLAKDIVFKLITPFHSIPPLQTLNKKDIKFYFAPLIFAQIEFDNSKYDKEMLGIFALQNMRRPLSDVSNDILGMVSGIDCGFAIAKQENVYEVLDWDVVKTVFSGNTNIINRLAFEGGLSFVIPPGKKITYSFVLGTYQGGIITSTRKMQFYYTEYFNDLEEVLGYGLNNIEKYIRNAEQKNIELKQAKLNAYRKFIIAHATHSYLANTELLIDENKRPVFIVNEGEYQMMNTLDLIVDQAFWEIYFTPWTVKNALDTHVTHYSFPDYVKIKNKTIEKAGIGFCHDQGVANMFSPNGNSSYEMSGKSSCFSYMTYEEILNWIITAGIYSILQNDFDWINEKKSLIQDLFLSIKNRDGNNDGIMDRDTNRCANGSEITTYDSLDSSLGQARNNLYLAVKTWAGYISISKLATMLKNNKLTAEAEKRAQLCTATIIKKFNSNENYIPAVFEGNNTAKIIPAVEGLIYPFIIGDKNAVSLEGRFGSFINILRKHIITVLKPDICLDKISGGWKLSSTSKNTWISKIFLNQYIIERILKIKSNNWEKWDKIHASWQQNGCALYACTDQVRSDTGKDLGSRYYPRLVTSILWLKY